jgi:tetratricopeptide (TPR) repeat protein
MPQVPSGKLRYGSRAKVEVIAARPHECRGVFSGTHREAREVLAAIKNPQIRHSIHGLPPARGHFLVETLVPPPAQRDSLRYAQVEDQAEDVRRWIVDEPVSVLRDPLAVRVLRWGRRDRALATSLAALLATAVIGLSIGVVLIGRERDRTEAQHLNGAQALLRKLASEFPAVAQYPLELASVEYNLGMIAASANHPDQAVAAYKESVRLLEPLRLRFPKSPAYRMKLALAEVALANAMRMTAPAEAEGSVRKALEEQSAVLAQYPGVPEYELEVGRGHYQLGLLLISLKPDEAILEAEKAGGLNKEMQRN